MADQDNKPGAARDDMLLELLQLHRAAVHQSDTDISDQFERRLREYREQLLAGSHKECPLTPEAILDYAGMHGLIPLRRQQWPASKAFNQKLIALVGSALSAAARAGVDAAAPVPVQVLTDGLRSGLCVCDELLHKANTPDRDLVQRAREAIESAMLALLPAPAAPATAVQLEPRTESEYRIPMPYAAPTGSANAVAFLKRLKSSLMHTRRFGTDTLATYRRACSDAEAEIEEWLNDNSTAMATENTALRSQPVTEEGAHD